MHVYEKGLDTIVASTIMQHQKLHSTRRNICRHKLVVMSIYQLEMAAVYEGVHS